MNNERRKLKIRPYAGDKGGQEYEAPCSWGIEAVAKPKKNKKRPAKTIKDKKPRSAAHVPFFGGKRKKDKSPKNEMPPDGYISELSPVKKKKRGLFPWKREKPPEMSPVESGATTVLDLLSPASADFHSRDYAVVDGVYHAYLYIAGYGYTTIVGNGWLNPLIEAGEDVNISFFIKRQQKDKILSSIAKTTMINRSRMRDVGDTRQDYEEMDSAINAGMYLKENMNRNGEDFYYIHTLIEIVAGEPAFNITLPEGNKNSVVEVVGDKTPPIMVGNLDKQFTRDIITPEEESTSTGDGIIVLEFIAEQLDEEIVPDEDKTKIGNQTPRGMDIGMYLDFSLWKKVTEWDDSANNGQGNLSDETTVSNIQQTPSLLEILIPLPTELQGMAVYRIVRIHNNVAEVITTSPNRNGEYIRLEKEDGQVVAITLFARNFSTYALAYSETELPTGGGSGGGGSSGSGGKIDGGSSAVSTATHWIEVPEAKTLVQNAQNKGLDYAQSRRESVTGIRQDSLLEIDRAGLSYRHDTTQNGAVQVRVYIDEPGGATKDILVSGHISGNAVDTVKERFEKFYPGKKLAFISFDQQGDFGMTIRTAAKVNLSGMNANNLYFYAYDKKTNKYVNFRPEYRIDANGYLHFATNRAGDIIISDGPLKDTGGGAVPQSPDMGVDALDNPETGGDGPGYLVQDAVQTQAPEQLIKTQEAEAMPDAQQAIQTEPDESAGPIKLQIPNSTIDTAALPSLDGETTTSTALILAAIITAAVLVSGMFGWFVVAKKRRRR